MATSTTTAWTKGFSENPAGESISAKSIIEILDLIGDEKARAPGASAADAWPKNGGSEPALPGPLGLAFGARPARPARPGSAGRAGGCAERAGGNLEGLFSPSFCG
jgi:hypothetical protein